MFQMPRCRTCWNILCSIFRIFLLICRLTLVPIKNNCWIFEFLILSDIFLPSNFKCVRACVRACGMCLCFVFVFVFIFVFVFVFVFVLVSISVFFRNSIIIKNIYILNEICRIYGSKII